MIIIKSDMIYSYPLDFSIYPFHFDLLKIDDNKSKSIFKRTKFINRISDSLSGNKSNPIIKVILLGLKYMSKSYLPISPKKIFGDDCLVERGTINKIIYLLKEDNNSDKIILEDIEPDELSEISTYILMSEWYVATQLLQIYSGLSAFSLDQMKDKITTVMQDSFSKSKCHTLIMPKNITLEEYFKQFKSKILQ
jgi:hypothetical protein